jgi:hypothetical protein
MPTKVRYDPILLCQDRAIGHDWDADAPKWEEGPDVRYGRRVVYVHHRVMDCGRCESQRVEIFEQNGESIEKTGNRYRYSRQYRDRDRLAPKEIHTQLWRLG